MRTIAVNTKPIITQLAPVDARTRALTPVCTYESCASCMATKVLTPPVCRRTRTLHMHVVRTHVVGASGTRNVLEHTAPDTAIENQTTQLI